MNAVRSRVRSPSLDLDVEGAVPVMGAFSTSTRCSYQRLSYLSNWDAAGWNSGASHKSQRTFT